MIYLDYAAATPVDPAVLERFCLTAQSFSGNPNSHHSAGYAASTEMERVSGSIASMLGINPQEIIYTSGASESNNLSIKGIARTSRHTGKHIISTALEHPSVSGCLTALQELGYEIDLVDIKSNGKIDLTHLQELLRKDTILAAVSAVDSELGTIQPIDKIIEILHDYPECHLHIDAAQAVGKTKLTFHGADTVSFTPHKFYGLNGSGILFKRKELVIEPLIHGGVSTTIYRSGTPTLALAAATDTALQLALVQQAERVRTVKQHNKVLRTVLSSYAKVQINSPTDAIPHILNLSVQGVKGNTFQKALDKYGICVSVKSACSVNGAPSRAVFAVSRNRKNAMCSWRISLSHLTTKDEIEQFLTAFDKCYQELVK